MSNKRQVKKFELVNNSISTEDMHITNTNAN